MWTKVELTAEEARGQLLVKRRIQMADAMHSLQLIIAIIECFNRITCQYNT